MVTKATDPVLNLVSPPISNIVATQGTITNATIGTLNLTNPLSVSEGGTGTTSITANHVIIGQGTSPVSSVAPGTAGLPLVSNGPSSAPTYQAISLTSGVTGVVPVANGGTGRSTLTEFAVLIGSGTSQITMVSPSTAGQALISNGAGSVPTFQAINIGSGISGVLPVSNGGTGQATLTDNALLVGNGTSAVDLVPAGFQYWPLVSNGPSSAPSYQNTIDIDTVKTQNLFIKGVKLEILTTNVTYYIATTGSNTTGNGSLASPWATLAYAYDTLIDKTNFGSFTVNLVMLSGTYNLNSIAFTAARGNWHIFSQTGNPADVVIAVTGFQQDVVHAQSGSNVTVSNITGSAQDGYAFVASGGAVLTMNRVNIGGSNSSHIVAYDNGSVQIIGNYTISGGGVHHYYAEHGTITASQSALPITVNSSGAVAFSGGFGASVDGGYIRAISGSYSGVTATGPRYLATTNGVIQTAGQNPATFFPGNSAGVATTGGIWA